MRDCTETNEQSWLELRETSLHIDESTSASQPTIDTNEDG